MSTRSKKKGRPRNPLHHQGCGGVESCASKTRETVVRSSSARSAGRGGPELDTVHARYYLLRMGTMKKPVRSGVAYIAEIGRDVPAYRPAVGQSAQDAAEALGFRLLARSEPREGAEAAIVEGLTFPAVKK